MLRIFGDDNGSDDGRCMKILIIGPAWIGDMIMAQTLFKRLKTEHPGCEIDVLAPDWTKPLLDRMPEVRQAVSMPIGHGQLKLLARYRIGRQLRDKYDWAIVLPNSFKSALIPFFARIPKRTGFVGECRYGLLNDVIKLDKQKYPLMVERFVLLGGALPKKYEWPKLIAKKPDLENVDLTKKILALCPGAAFGPAKRWPYFGELANLCLNDDWQVWLFGSNADAEIANEINAKTNNRCVDLTGQTNLARAIDLLSVVSAVVTNDSGLMHVACALDRRVIALYGSSSPDFTPPLSEHAKKLWLHIECSPCFERVCPLKHFNCMRKLSVEMVVSQLRADKTHAVTGLEQLRAAQD